MNSSTARYAASPSVPRIHSRWSSLASSRALILAIALFGAASVASAVDASLATPTAGVFTGRYESGTPIYRLPPLSVTAKRGAVALEARTQKRDTRAGRASRDAPARGAPVAAS